MSDFEVFKIGVRNMHSKEGIPSSKIILYTRCNFITSFEMVFKSQGIYHLT